MSYDTAASDHNRAVAVEHFSLATMGDRIRALLADAGWLP